MSPARPYGLVGVLWAAGTVALMVALSSGEPLCSIAAVGLWCLSALPLRDCRVTS